MQYLREGARDKGGETTNHLLKYKSTVNHF